MSKMSTLTKISLVIGGYILACLIAGGVIYVYDLLTQDTAAQASSGMSAFGDLILFVSVFVFLALIPTGLAIYFLFKKFMRR